MVGKRFVKFVNIETPHLCLNGCKTFWALNVLHFAPLRDIESDLVIKWLIGTVEYSRKIEKLKSWHWGLITESQRVTWTAFAILAMFLLMRSLDVICLIHLTFYADKRHGGGSGSSCGQQPRRDRTLRWGWLWWRRCVRRGVNWNQERFWESSLQELFPHTYSRTKKFSPQQCTNVER